MSCSGVLAFNCLWIMGAQQTLRDRLLPQGHNLGFLLVFVNIVIELIFSLVRINAFYEIYLL